MFRNPGYLARCASGRLHSLRRRIRVRHPRGRGVLRGKHRSGARGRARRRDGGPRRALADWSALIIPREGGKAFVVPKGHILRVIAIDGQQVCDFNAFNLKKPEEAFWAGGSRSLEGTRLTVGGASSGPSRGGSAPRVMFTILANSVEQTSEPQGLPLRPDPPVLALQPATLRQTWHAGPRQLS